MELANNIGLEVSMMQRVYATKLQKNHTAAYKFSFNDFKSTNEEPHG